MFNNSFNDNDDESRELIMVGSGRRACEYNIENMMPESSTFRFLLVWFGLYPISKNVKHKHYGLV